MSDQGALDHSSRVDLNFMLDAIKRDAPQFFRMGKMRARKKLPNGYVVVVTIAEPAPSKKRTAQRQGAERGKP